MHLKNTAKFGANNNESIINRFHTEITENIGRSQMLIKGEESYMNISDLDASKGDYIILNGTHKIPQDPRTTYRCPICDRLRAICPSKNYKTYEYCQKCIQPAQGRRTRPRIFDSVGHIVSKDLNSTFNETKGHSFNQLSNGVKHLQQVNKVRFVQSNNVFQLKPPTSNYSTLNGLNQTRVQQNRKRTTTNYEFQRSVPINHQVIKEQIQKQPLQVGNVQEIIFYPVIHNKLVYRSANRNGSQSYQEDMQMGRSRYHSHHGGNRNKKGIEKVVSDFLQTTKPDEVLTPSQFKKLADSIYRQNNPNVQEEIHDSY